ncbi:MAG: DUF1499 domain-containing protein [Leptospiraceae bacterium]|nr:DUF1499 domain-containing protein [Leptospiraceae bacterium]MCP5498503.1 DUF1499 domain-containing protein [Leptospiraceae bacterium]
MKRGIIFGLLLLLTTLSCNRKSQKSLMITEGVFSPCPKSPNCISSQEKKEDKEHYIEAIVYSSSREDAQKKMIVTLQKLPRVKLVKKTDNYLHAEFTTLLMRYVDDVEFYFPENNKLIHIRSASRVGYSDLGKNRSRMKEIKQLFEKE